MLNTSRAEITARAKEIVKREAQAVQALADQFGADADAAGSGPPPSWRQGRASIADVVALLLDCQGHVLVTGAGTSHAMAQRFAHLLCCCGTPALCISAADSIHGGAGAVTADDVVFVISKGGHSAEINQFADIARERGAKVIAQTENLDSPLAQMSDAVYHVQTMGDVDPYGMIATGSSLVNGAAGDVLCVLLLEASGYSREDFGATHPGGAVGKKLAESA